ncbi:hypothetical protein NKI96_22660 [Mesorhizobium sp. M0292]|uniref:hypothetical protein n=1 Tax=Mesorhizobium sp. M0292 TaxID=2956929 RepID=UPI00333A781C
MLQSFDASRSLTALEQDNTIIAVIEMSKAKWLVAALVPGPKRQPLKKLDADAPALLKRSSPHTSCNRRRRGLLALPSVKAKKLRPMRLRWPTAARRRGVRLMILLRPRL